VSFKNIFQLLISDITFIFIYCDAYVYTLIKTVIKTASKTSNEEKGTKW